MNIDLDKLISLPLNKGNRYIDGECGYIKGNFARSCDDMLGIELTEDEDWVKY